MSTLPFPRTVPRSAGATQKVLIASRHDLRPDLGRTVLWRGSVQRFYASDPDQVMEIARVVTPNLTVVDVGAAVRQAQEVIDQLITAVQFVFLFALGAGLLVLYSALVATEDERRREAAVMRVYGASRAQVTGAQRMEFLAMGAIAGVLATLGAAAIGQLLARRVFELDLPPSLALWIAGPLAGLALLSLNAWLSSRKVLRASPAITLRESV